MVWPRVSTWVEELVRHTIEPAITAALPQRLRARVHFTEVQLGESRPDFGPLSVEKVADDAISLQLGIDMDTDMRVGLRAMGVYIGVSKLKVHGVLSVIFRPQQESPPFFGGVEVYFVNAPEVDLDFHGIARVAEIPGLRHVVRSAITGAINHAIVLPNVVAVDLNGDDNVDAVDLQSPDPVAVLQLTLHRGRNLIAADWSLVGPRSSDPYVAVTLGCKTWTSPVVKQSLNPEWGEDGDGITADFLVHSESQHIKFEVYDEDYASSDDLIGVALVKELSELTRKVPAGSLPLKDPSGAARPAGDLVVSGKLLRATSEARARADGRAPVLFLAAKVMEVTGLPPTGNVPFKVRVAVNGAVGVTKTSSPRANQPVAELLQGLCYSLVQKGYTHEEVADLLHVSAMQVRELLCSRPSFDAKMKKAVDNEVHRQAAMNPQFGQTVQLLVPPDSHGCDIELALVDKRGEVVGAAKVPVERVLRAGGESLSGTFALEPVGGALRGSLRLKWFAPEERVPWQQRPCSS